MTLPFRRSQFNLKKVGPKPSGLGLELSFMEKRACRTSLSEKGQTKEAAWVESREVEAT
jgi:hypothetical protein